MGNHYVVLLVVVWLTQIGANGLGHTSNTDHIEKKTICIQVFVAEKRLNNGSKALLSFYVFIGGIEALFIP